MENLTQEEQEQLSFIINSIYDKNSSRLFAPYLSNEEQIEFDDEIFKYGVLNNILRPPMSLFYKGLREWYKDLIGTPLKKIAFYAKQDKMTRDILIENISNISSFWLHALIRENNSNSIDYNNPITPHVIQEFIKRNDYQSNYRVLYYNLVPDKRDEYKKKFIENIKDKIDEFDPFFCLEFIKNNIITPEDGEIFYRIVNNNLDSKKIENVTMHYLFDVVPRNNPTFDKLAIIFAKNYGHILSAFIRKDFFTKEDVSDDAWDKIVSLGLSDESFLVMCFENRWISDESLVDEALNRLISSERPRMDKAFQILIFFRQKIFPLTGEFEDIFNNKKSKLYKILLYSPLAAAESIVYEYIDQDFFEEAVNSALKSRKNIDVLLNENKILSNKNIYMNIIREKFKTNRGD